MDDDNDTTPLGLMINWDCVTQGSAWWRNPGLRDGTPLAFTNFAERQSERQPRQPRADETSGVWTK
jgi:hypothetical protein